MVFRPEWATNVHHSLVRWSDTHVKNYNHVRTPCLLYLTGTCLLGVGRPGTSAVHNIDC
jgi:hypothetical protein